MVNQRNLAILYCYLLISCLSDHLVFTQGYRDDRNNIVQRRPTIRTENDNIVLESPRGRNITLSPGEGGFVKIGNTVIDPKAPAAALNGNGGATGPQGPPGPKGDPGVSISVEQILAQVREEFTQRIASEVAERVAEMERKQAELQAQIEDLAIYTWKDTFPAIFEFYTHAYGERHNNSFEFGDSGLIVMTDEGGIYLGQSIRGGNLESQTTYALTFYLKNTEETARGIAVSVTGSDKTEILINDNVVTSNCGDNATLSTCTIPRLPFGSFKLTLKVSDEEDVLESIGFGAKWITYNNLTIDWAKMNSVIRKSPSSRRKK